MIEIIYSGPYSKKEKKFLKRHPDVSGLYQKTLKLLKLNPYHPSLRLHKLTGNLSELHSVSINTAFRISIIFFIQDDKIIPVDIGTHEEICRG